MTSPLRSFAILPLVFIIVLKIVTPCIAAQKDLSCQRALVDNREMLTHDSYNRTRDADGYARMLGDTLLDDINSLGPNTHWLESGAGAAIAMQQFADGAWIDHQIIKARSDRLTALAFNRPESREIEILSQMRPLGQFRYLQGKYLEEYSFEEIGATDLITDVYGPFSYSADLDNVLRKYLELLNIGGKVYIFYDPQVLSINGNYDGIIEYIRSIPNIRVHFGPMNRGQAIRIEKFGQTQNSDIPELVLESFFSHAPPYRQYRIAP